jgi:hypothetical protein
LRARTLSQKIAITECISWLVLQGQAMATIGLYSYTVMPFMHDKFGTAGEDQNVGAGLPAITVDQQ